MFFTRAFFINIFFIFATNINQGVVFLNANRQTKWIFFLNIFHMIHQEQNNFHSTPEFFFPMKSECGGKMHLREEEYDNAATDFFEVNNNTQ